MWTPQIGDTICQRDESGFVCAEYMIIAIEENEFDKMYKLSGCDQWETAENINAYYEYVSSCPRYNRLFSENLEQSDQECPF